MRRAALVALLLVALPLAAPAGAVHETGDEFRVHLQADGDARVVLKTTYDLSRPDERERFRRLRNDSAARAERVGAFRERLKRAATSAEDATGRAMRVGNVAIATERHEDTGVVRLRATWTNLAAVTSERLVVTAPFGRSLSVNRSLVVAAPAGFERRTTRPPPARALKRQATWAADQDLSGFRAAFVGPTETPTPTGTPTPSGVGAFVGAAALALLPAAALAAALLDRGT